MARPFRIQIGEVGIMGCRVASIAIGYEAETREPVRLERRGGFGRDVTLKVGRDLSGLSLRQLGEQAGGGLDYVSVCMAIRRLEQKMKNEPPVTALINRVKERCE